MDVLVEHDYIAKEPNELTITKGDIIKDVIKKHDGWLEGTLRDKKGLFPDNFVKVMEKEPQVVLRNRQDVARIRQCRVVFSYKQDHEDELTLTVGDVIEILGEEEEGWWRGVLQGKEGVFPSNFVEVIVPQTDKLKEKLSNEFATFIKSGKTLCEVKFAYKAQNEDELTLKEGDIVVLLSKEGQDPGWWKGELNGRVGVFPDNFVILLPPLDEESSKENDKKNKVSPVEPASTKQNTVSAQRKSLEAEKDEASTKTTPPLPSKKPSIPVKKSPSGSGSSAAGLLYGIKKKLADVVDGATGSKISPKTEENVSNENVFDDVHRRPLLADVRASRPKAPGRRPPSMIGRDLEPGLVNGNTDHAMDPETHDNSDTDAPESKPKLREWEKHPAPWLEEMKLNQAKRSTSDKLKLTPTEKADDKKKEASPVEKSKPVAGANRMKTPPNEFPMIRSKPAVPIPSRPQTIQNVSEVTPKKFSPIASKSPLKGEEDKIAELEQRIARLEELLEKQQQVHESALGELRGKLQLETEMRMQLQAKFEKFASDAATKP